MICKHIKIKILQARTEWYDLITVYEQHHFVVSCPSEHTIFHTSSPLSLYTACWQCRELNHRLNSFVSHMARYKQKDLFFFLSNLNPSGFYTFSHCLATTLCSSLVLPSLFAPLSDLHGRLPVYVRRASSQSAVKAVILLVAIYYPVVCLKKDWKRAKPGAGCWVSSHTKLHTRVHNWPIYNTSLLLCLWKCVYAPVRFDFLCCFSLGELFIYLLIVFLTAQQDLHADIFLVAAEGWNVLVCEIQKITKQHEAAAYKLWMRSRPANTTRRDMRGDFVLDSPLVVSYLRFVFLLPRLRRAHFHNTIAGHQNCLPCIRSVIICLEWSVDCAWKQQE